MSTLFKNQAWRVMTLFGIASLALSFQPVMATSAPTTPTTAKPVDYFNAKISATEIKAAGFIEPTIVTPTTNRFLAPVYYFRVKDMPANAAGDAWGDSKNLVSVLIRPIADKKWVYNNGDIQLIDHGGRYEARVSSPGYYLVVSGPDKDKTVTLVHNLKVLY